MALYMTAVAAARDDAPGLRKAGAETTGGGMTTPGPRKKQQQQQADDPPQEQGLRCPRCDSPNTKFCYYNNYSLSQPRHFCKACRRYWTKGGALRNVPVGGGCRKNKRSHRSSAAASRLLALNLPADGVGGAAAAASRVGFLGGGGAPVVVSPSPIGGGAATLADYQCAAAGMLALPRIQHAPSVGQYVSFEQWTRSGPAGDLAGVGGGNVSAGLAMNAGAAEVSSIASSIESLSFINLQDLHWKLQQQQRLATMFLPPSCSGAAAAHVDGAAAAPAHMSAAAPGPDMDPAPAVTTSWFMDSSYVLPCPPPPPANTATAIATPNNNCGSGIPAWGDMSTFAVLP